ncbi:phage head spike fiber domain-containing protein [Parasedimentitalea huanghaiensis]|uniref:Uncharacterized protein n=1 Tax=Parasedimentitalea huanghaiensis TaxID=2682100 RepID=A0A6L6WK83_9RHOB|nr:hypothetical protein [Zongyanglinia huanghaiensis]MVO17379.1 hypothetical protein [Zongyanglinia huanghaiensis]
MSGSLPAVATFTRASEAIEVQNNGNFVTRVADAPRFDHSPLTGKLLGLRFEPEATNLVVHSRASVADWITDSCTTSNLSLNALGMFPGVEVASTGQVWGRVKQNVSLTSGQLYQVTCLMRVGTSPNARISISGAGGETQVAGTVGSMSNIRTELGICTDIIEEGLLDGFTRRVRFVFLSDVTGPYQIGLGPQTSTLGETIELLGIQVEQSAQYSSFILSGASAGVRATDGLTLALADGTYEISLHYADAPSETYTAVEVVSGYEVIATGHTLKQITTRKL